jgi:hypothetical protein
MAVNKKGLLGIVIFLIVIFIVIIIIATVLIIASKKGLFNKESNLETLPFYMQARESGTDKIIPANYRISYFNEKNERVLVSEGKLSDSYTEFNVPKTQLEISCYDENHYLVKAYKSFSEIDYQNNKSTFICDIVKIGEINASYSGNFKNINNIIVLNISSDNYLFRPSICFSWTSGVSDVSLENQFIECQGSSWRNWTIFNATKKEYEYLPNGSYICGEDYIENCLFVEGNKCKKTTEEIPSRFKGLVDSCSYIDKEINNNTISLNILIKTEEFKNDLDKITIFLYDKDRRFIENDYKWVSEINGKDISAKDLELIIPYSECSENYCTL